MRLPPALAIGAMGTALLLPSCLSVKLYNPSQVELAPSTTVSTTFPLPVLLKKTEVPDIPPIRLPGTRRAIDVRDRVLDNSVFEPLSKTMTEHVAQAFDRTSIFTRTLGPEDPTPVFFVELTSRVLDLRFEAVNGRPVAVGSVEFSASIWPSAAKIWTTSIAVTLEDIVPPKVTSAPEAPKRRKSSTRRWKPGPTWGIFASAAIDRFVAKVAETFVDRLARADAVAVAVNNTVQTGVLGPRNSPSNKPAPRPRSSVVAIFDLESKSERFKPGDLIGLTDYIGAVLTQSGRFEVIPRRSIIAALRKQKIESYDECYAESCRLEIGKELAAEKTLSGAIVEFADRCIVTLQLFDLRKATQEAAGTAKSGCDAESVLASIEDAVAKLTAAAPSSAQLD